MIARHHTLALLIGFACAPCAHAEDRLNILDEGDAAAIWRPVAETMAMPAYPGVVADKSEDVCISVGYQLKPDGSTSDFAVLRAWGGSAASARPTDPHFLPFAQNALAAVQRWRFASVAGTTAKVRPIYTTATFAFTTVGSDATALKQRCRVDNLRAFIAKAQAQASKKGMNRAQMEAANASRAQSVQPVVPPGTTP